MGTCIFKSTTQQWLLDTEKEVKASERESERSPPRDTQERLTDHFWRASPSQPSGDSPEEVVSRESASSSTTTPGTSSRDSSAVSSETLSPTPSTPRGRPSPLWTSSTPSRDREEPFTASVHKH